MAREGAIVTKGIELDETVAAELKALRDVKRKYERLPVEHDLLGKPSRVAPARSRKGVMPAG